MVFLKAKFSSKIGCTINYKEKNLDHWVEDIFRYVKKSYQIRMAIIVKIVTVVCFLLFSHIIVQQSITFQN